MKLRTKFQQKYYQQVIDIHQMMEYFAYKIKKLDLVPVSRRQMHTWILNFEAENGKGTPERIMKAKKAKEAEELDALKERIADLEEQLRVEKLRNRRNETIIDIAEQRWHIEIRKKLAPSSKRPARRIRRHI